MSLKDVRVAVENFLKSDRPHAIAISGSWGSGKTYFWGEVIKEASAKKLVTKYSYLSLFGINNLADLKASIFDNAVSAQDIGSGASSSTWLQNVKEIAQSYSLDDAKEPGRHLFNLGRKNVSQIAPLLGAWGGVARSLSFFAVKNYVICLDDVERKGDGLPLKEIFGLVSMLKEQRGCRVAIILNDGELENDRRVLDAFKEKVFDSEIVFSPSVEECAKLVFDDQWEHSDEVIEKVVQLRIKNIRVLQRIRRVIETLLPYLQGKDVALTKQLIHSSVLLTWCYNSRGKDVPSYEIVKHLTMALWVRDVSKKEEVSEEQKLAEKVLIDYGYRDSDEFDLSICRFLENGFVEEDGFVAVVNSFQERALQNNHSGSFAEAWGLFLDTFADNENALVETMRERFLNGAKWISLGDAMGTVKLMRDLKHEDVADELMNHWIGMAKKKNKELLNLKMGRLSEGSFDEKFRDAVKMAYSSARVLPTLAETIKDLYGKRGWNMEQIEILSKASVDDYYEFFKSIGVDDNLGSYIRTCLEFGSFSDGEERYKKIHANASDALRKIAGESHLNKVRISRYLPEIVA